MTQPEDLTTVDHNHDLEPEGLPGSTAAEKIMATIRALSSPDPDAGELALTLASVAMLAEGRLGPQLAEGQASGELDDFVRDLARWIATHRSDDVRQLVVVELPRRELPAGTRLHLLDEALAAAASAGSPL